MDNKAKTNDCQDTNKGGRQSNNRRGSRRPQSKGNKQDFAWYNKHPDLIKSVASVAYPYVPGMAAPQLFAWQGDTSSGTVASGFKLIPGMAVLDWIPTMGISNTSTSPISLVARDIFSKVRAAFSGSIDADAPDFIMQLGALDSIYSYIEWMRRVYKVCFTWNYRNLLSPNSILAGMGFTDDQIHYLLAHRTELESKLIELIAMADWFVLPDIYPVIERHKWMSGRIYTDEYSVKSQLYMFNLAGVYKFSVDSNTMGQLTLKPIVWQTGPDIITQMYDFGRDLIESLSNWDDCFMINGYLERAFKDTPVVKVAPLVTNERVELAYNPAVSSQIHNATWLPVTSQHAESFISTVTQKPIDNTVYTQVAYKNPQRNADYILKFAGARIDSMSDDPSLEDTIENTRLICQFEQRKDVDGLKWLEVTTVGTELITAFNLLITRADRTNFYNCSTNTITVGVEGSNSLKEAERLETERVIDTIMGMSPFSDFPSLPVAYRLKMTDEISQYTGYLYGNVHNITTITESMLNEINRACLYSEFNAFSS